MKRFSYLFLIVATFLVGSGARAQVSPAELNTRMSYWAGMLPYCTYAEGSFPSKDNCDDGDSVSLNGLTCAAGDGAPGIFGQLAAQACDAVKHSQGTKSGEWYRSPKKRYEIENNLPTTTEKASSNDSAQGVWAYIAQRKDVDAFRRWTGWMKDHKEGGIFWPRYCADKQCDFNVGDCPMLDRLAAYLGEGNALCDLPPMISSDVPIKAMQAGFNVTVSTINQLPGANVFAAQINSLKNSINAAFAQAISLAQKADDAKEKLETLTRVIANQSGVITFVGSYVDKSGPARQDVAYASYLLKKYGGLTAPDVDSAAKVVASKEPENAFFEYVAHGPTPLMLQQILLIDGIQRCPSKASDKPHVRDSWIWETEDRQTDPGKPQPWVETMYWDCLFVANLYRGGPIKGINLPAPPGYAAASQMAEQQIQNTIDGTKTLLATLDQIRLQLQDPTHPPTPAQVWKLLTDAHDATIKMLPGPVQPLAQAVPKPFQPPSWLPAHPAPPTPKQILQHPLCPCHGHPLCPC